MLHLRNMDVIQKAGVANYFESSGKFKYKRVAVYDASTSDLLAHASAVVTFIATALIHGSVLVHCQHGVSRSPTCVAFYLMSRQAMTLEEAMTCMKATRPAIEPIPAFRKQLQDYEKLCFKSERTAKRGTKRKQDSKEGAPPQQDGCVPIGPALPRTYESVTTSIEQETVAVRRKIGPSWPHIQYKVDVSDKSPPQIGPLLPASAEVTIELPRSPFRRKENRRKTIIGPAAPSAGD